MHIQVHRAQWMHIHLLCPVIVLNEHFQFGEQVRFRTTTTTIVVVMMIIVVQGRSRSRR